MIRDQVRNRARHRRHRRVRLRSRRGLLSQPRPGRRNQQARSHRPCDRATQSFHRPPSRFEFPFHHDPRLRDGPPLITFRGDSVLNFYVAVILPLLCHPRFFPSVILDMSNRGSSVVVFGLCLFPSYPRHPMAPPQGACGRGCAPVPTPVWGEDCLSAASSAALTFGTGAKAPPWGHARAPMVLGPFAETKGPRRAGPKPRKDPPPSACGAETPQSPPPRARPEES